ncbi:hypothetical protein EC9_25020 [Rosistilla ulvae]|uniref:Uncharacterized protein n=1 Tax=Rosistilla ulvae TaxID=1930277 RepID=A0A517M0A8_9BACT|nr:hypothetical protein [Rosistilla ulvae]QDS88312.1 hypothetical protein EC9_25020 [Rosistilla ulvae]
MVNRLALLIAILMATEGIACDLPASEGAMPQFIITTKRSDDKVVVSQQGAETRFAIQCPFGIGRAVIRRTADAWPSDVTIRLYLKGLEDFRIDNGSIVLQAFVASSDKDGSAAKTVLIEGDASREIDRSNPYWIEIRRGSGDVRSEDDGKPEERYFDLRLPQAIFLTNPVELKLRWIDFYRS